MESVSSLKTRSSNGEGECSVNSCIRYAPITGRKQFMCQKAESDYIARAKKVSLPAEHRGVQEGDAILDSVKGILNKLLRTSTVKKLGVTPHLSVINNIDGPSAWAIQLLNTICINFRILMQCSTEGQVASVLGHEIGHLIAQHAHEIDSHEGYTDCDSSWFVEDEQVKSKMKGSIYWECEFEADHIGLVLMAKAGYHPQENLDRLKKAEKFELKYFGKDHVAKSHPSCEARIAYLTTILPKAEAQYEKSKPISSKENEENWASIRDELNKRIYCSRKGNGKGKGRGVAEAEVGEVGKTARRKWLSVKEWPDIL